MPRPPIPTVLSDLWLDPRAFRVLLVAVLSMAAAGLNPVVTSPNLASVQSLIRAQPEINALVILITLISGGLLFVGGVLGDTDGRRGILLGALALLASMSVVGLVTGDGPLFTASRLAGGAAAYAVVPFALALVATTYPGAVRATAIGIVYAAYAGATAITPVLLTILGPGGPTWPAFVVSAVVAVAALWFARSRTPNLPAAMRTDRPYVIATAVWALAFVVIAAGLVDVGNRLAGGLRLGLVSAGLAMIGAYAIWDWRMKARSGPQPHRVERRPVAIAVAVGVIVAFAQAAPLFQLTIFFNLILGYGAVWAAIATAPFILALVAAGPVAGLLLARFKPRTLVAGGLAAVGLGNIVAAALIGQDVWYLAMILPLVLIGAGFVLATTIRTAIIFASVSGSLPATAAALNEASLLVGTRIGLAALTALITQRALDIYAASLGTSDPGQTAAVAAFREVLIAIGTPGIYQIAELLDPSDLAAYISAFLEAYRQSLFGVGLVAVVAAVIAWLGLGARDPLTTVWDHRDERTPVEASPS